MGGVGACTLLGPEGPGAAAVAAVCWTSDRPSGRTGFSGAVWGHCSSVENYIVDASILEMTPLRVVSQ